MCEFVKLINLKINMENTFVHKLAWVSICDFAFTCKDDAWGIPNYSKYVSLFNPEDIPAGSLIFATPHCIERFLQEIHPKIKNPYVLVTYSYGPVFAVSKYINDPKIIGWFGTTNGDAITFDKFNILPLGIFGDEQIFSKRTEILHLLNQLKVNSKTDLLYMNFVRSPHGGRKEVYDLFKDKQYCHTVTLTETWRKPWKEYIIDMSRAKFTLSPEGDMHDCYRHWESIFVGSIPVVHKSPLDSIFKDLPVVIVDDYRDVTEDFLNKKYEEMKDKKYNLDKLYMKYWIDLINQTKNNYGLR